MLARKVGDWNKLSNLLGKIPKAVETATNKAIKKEGHFLRTKIVDGIRDQAPGGKQFLPLAVTTLAVRKFKGFNGTKALIKTGDLRNSVQVMDAPQGCFIGIERNAKGKNGKSMIDIAVLHEQGSGPIVIRVTAKMRKFLMMAFRQAGLQGPYGRGTGLLIMKIPARPFIGPVFEKFSGQGSRDRIEKEMVRLLTGTLA